MWNGWVRQPVRSAPARGTRGALEQAVEAADSFGDPLGVVDPVDADAHVFVIGEVEAESPVLHRGFHGLTPRHRNVPSWSMLIGNGRTSVVLPPRCISDRS